MPVIFKHSFTRMSLDHLFLAEYIIARSFFGTILHPIGNISFKPKKKTNIELISWEEIFQKKHQLRPDLRHEIDSKNLTSDMMYSIDAYHIGHRDPPFNPFSLTWTELWEYDYLNDAIEDRDKILKMLHNYSTILENQLITELYDNDGTLVETVNSY